MPSGQYPTALDEKDFIVPGGHAWTSNEGRRNLTDQQELAQWLGGVSVPSQILSNLLQDIKAAIIFHPTSYDGAVERAGIAMGFPVFSCASSQAVWSCSRGIVREHLLEARLCIARSPNNCGRVLLQTFAKLAQFDIACLVPARRGRRNLHPWPA